MLRFANIAGGYGTIHDPNTNAIIPHVLASARTGEPVPIHGAGDSVRDYLHGHDAADAIITTLTPRHSFRRYNVDSGHGASITDAWHTSTTTQAP